jgi:hypothetical protein
MGQYARSMKERSGISKSSEEVHNTHPETLPSAMKRDEQHVAAMTSHIRI